MQLSSLERSEIWDEPMRNKHRADPGDFLNGDHDEMQVS